MSERLPTFIIKHGDEPPRAWPKRRIWIGSHADCELRLEEHFTISATHAAIEWDGERFQLTDVDPANATLLNHRQIEYGEPAALGDGDAVLIGPYLLEIEHAGETLRIEVTRLLLASDFIIRRRDVEKQIETIIRGRDGLLICNPTDERANDADANADKVILNHPKVSPVHAGINRLRDRFDKAKWKFYLIDLSPSNTTYLSKCLLSTYEPRPINDGDVAQIGPYDLTFKLADDPALAGTLDITVTQVVPGAVRAQPASTAAPAPDEAAAALRIFWGKRTREKAAGRTPLHPARPEQTGKARYRWRSTHDLARPWAAPILFWGALAASLVVLSVFALSGKNAFAPRPLAAAHARAAFSLQPVTARRWNANDCTTCHVRGQKMNDACTACHQTDAFAATITLPHAAAGIGCTDCHSEHRGADFRPGVEPLSASFQPGVRPEETCMGCHNDANKHLYNGRALHTPHSGDFRGKFGYPVSPAGEWVWHIDEAEWKWKATDVVARFKQTDYKNSLSAQFHGLHIGRVRAREVGLNADERGMLSCSSCHKSWGAKLDRATPRDTCARCHDGRIDTQTRRPLIAADQPNCTSCHVQHVLDKRRNPELLAPVAPRAQAANAPGAATR